jgi:DNA-binding GntR family transcriptional regulator
MARAGSWEGLNTPRLAPMWSPTNSGRTVLAVGAVLPGENVLAQERGVGRVTVRRAYAFLEAEGLIEKRPGMGRVVKPRSKGDT